MYRNLSYKPYFWIMISLIILAYGVNVPIKFQFVRIDEKDYSFKSKHGSTILMCGLLDNGLFLCMLIYIWMQLWRLPNGETWH